MVAEIGFQLQVSFKSGSSDCLYKAAIDRQITVVSLTDDPRLSGRFAEVSVS